MGNSTNKTTVTTAAILAVGALLLVAAALVGNSEEISYPDTFDFQPADYDAGTAIVVSKRVTGGMKLLGFEFREAVYRVDVAFTVPGQECFFALAEQEEWPVADASCVGPQHVTGTLAGLGNTAEGGTYVAVSIEVGETCYSSVTLGERWAAKVSDCI
jgi:hypothetical protein